MWCEIRRHTLRHLDRGYWSALRVERMRSESADGWVMPRQKSGDASSPATAVRRVYSCGSSNSILFYGCCNGRCVIVGSSVDVNQ
jgi:hypothetical protein